MVKYCCVPFCKSLAKKKILSGDYISFHEFPVHEDYTRQWLRRIARKDFVLNDKSVVCSKHFTPDDFLPNSKYRRLKKNAVPTVFPMYPSYALFPRPNSNRSPSSLDHVNKPTIIKYERTNPRKKVRGKNSTINKSTDQHNEDQVFIKEEEISEDDMNTPLLQTLNHLKKLSTEKCKKKVATGITSNSERTFTENNTVLKGGQGIVAITAENKTESLTEKNATYIDFDHNMISINSSSPEHQVLAFNDENIDFSAANNSISLVSINHMNRGFINETETLTGKDGSSIALNSDLVFTNNNLSEKPREVYVLTSNESNQDHPAANNCHSLVSLNRPKRSTVSVSASEYLTVKDGTSMDIDSSVTFSQNNLPKQSSANSVHTINAVKKGLPATNTSHSLIGINYWKKQNNTKNYTDSTSTGYSDMTSHNNLADQKKYNRPLTLNDLINKSVMDKSREIRHLKSLLLKNNKKMKTMKEKIDKLEDKVSVYESKGHHEILRKIDAKNSVQSNFIMDQVDNYVKKRPTWRESTIRECATWVAVSPEGYDFVRERKLMILPSRKTLLKYAYSGEQKVDFCNLGSGQEESPVKSATESSAVELF